MDQKINIKIPKNRNISHIYRKKKLKKCMHIERKNESN